MNHTAIGIPQEKSRRRNRTAALHRACLEHLESRMLLSAAPIVSKAAPAFTHGYSATTFAAAPVGASQPDSIVVDGKSVFVGFGNGVAKDGSDGKSSTIVQYNSAGAVVHTFSVPGHNDGLKVDPATHLLWALQNEDGNPKLVVINPTTVAQTPYTFAPPANGGGYDDIAFLGGKTYISESNPSANPNTAPAIVQATLSGSTVTVTPVLLGNAAATTLKHKQVTLNLQDPDSLTTDPSGDLVLTSQADNELVIVKNPGTAGQAVTLVPLTDAKKTAVSVDDSLFPPSSAGDALLTDQTNNVIYRVSGHLKRTMLSAAQDIGQLGKVDIKTGRFTPVITGLGSPRGLAFLPQTVFTSHGYTATNFATAPAGASQPDSIAVDGSSVFVGFGNGVAKDGSDGKSSTIVQYNSAGAVVHTFSVPGHNDGLKVDPATHLLWALQNEDGNPNLVVINPTTAAQTPYSFATPANGGGYDDIIFVGGKTYISESNPSANPNTAPAIVQATLSGSTVTVTPVLLGNATATTFKHKQVTLNLQDPDSLTSDAAGDLVLTSQADNELIVVKNPGAAGQTVTLIPLTDAKKKAVSVDDSLFPPSTAGDVLLTDQTNNVIYRVSGHFKGTMLSAAQDIGQLGKVDIKTGRFTPVITGLGSPRGLAFL